MTTGFSESKKLSFALERVGKKLKSKNPKLSMIVTQALSMEESKKIFKS